MSSITRVFTSNWRNSTHLPPIEQIAAVGQSLMYGPPLRYHGRSSTAYRLSDRKGVWRNQGGW